jgi:hypothetical protein
MHKDSPRWVNDLLVKREVLTRVFEMPVGRLLGCGGFGCVFKAQTPWTVKFTIDPDEGPMWARLWKLQQTECALYPAIPRIKEVVRLQPDVVLSPRRPRITRKLYAVVREELSAPLAKVAHDHLNTEPALRRQLGGIAAKVGDYSFSSRRGENYSSAAIADLDRIDEPLGQDIRRTLWRLATVNQISFHDLHDENLALRIHGRIIGFPQCGELEVGQVVVMDVGHNSGGFTPRIRKTMLANARWEW